MPWRTQSGNRFFSRNWWNQRTLYTPGEDLGTYLRRSLERFYGYNMEWWPHEVGASLRRTTANNVRDHVSYHQYIDWLYLHGWEVIMAQNTLQEGRFVRLGRMNDTPHRTGVRVLSDGTIVGPSEYSTDYLERLLKNDPEVIHRKWRST
jgi:hypothetical protein